MIAYLEKYDTTVDVPDDLGQKDLEDVNNNLPSYIGQKEQPNNQAQAEPNQQKQPVENTPQTKWTPNFYESFVKPNLNSIIPALSLTGLPLTTPQEKVTPESTAFAGKAAEEATFGLAKPITELPEFQQAYKDHPAFATAGQFAGGVGSLMETGAALRLAGLGELGAQAGKAAVEKGLASGERFIPKVIMEASTFGTRTFIAETVKAFQDGKVDLEQFGKDVLKDAAFGGFLGFLNKFNAEAATRIAAAGGLWFAKAKMDGADNKDAALQATIGATFEGIGSIGAKPELILEGINNLKNSVADYVDARAPEGTLGTKGSKLFGNAFVDNEIRKAGFENAEELSKAGPEQTLQVIENLNQKVRQGIIPSPISETPTEQLKLGSPEVVEQASSSPMRPPSSRWTNEPGAMTGEPILYLDGSEDNARAAITENEIEGKGVYYSVTDNEGKLIGNFSTVEQAQEAAEKAFPEKQPNPTAPTIMDIDKPVSSMLPPETQEPFKSMAQAIGIDPEIKGRDLYKALVDHLGSDEAAVKTLQDLGIAGIQHINEQQEPTQTFFTGGSISTPKEKPVKIDENGIPVLKPNSVVSTIQTPEGETAKITHKMVLDEAHDLLTLAKEQHGTVDPLVEFVRSQGGIKGFKGGIESEEFKKVPIHVRGQIDADEMAQMAYDRNLLDEPSADLLRNYLGSIKPKGAIPKLGDFYNEALHNLEGYFMSAKGVAEARSSYNASLARQRGIEGFQAAIKDPLTGEIYSGGSHSEIIANAIKQNMDLGERIVKEEMNDTENVGFIDENGEFMTRKRAEKHFGILNSESLRERGNEFGENKQKKDLENRAIQQFGITKDIKKAGYILDDGRMIDLSGGNKYRDLGHFKIGEILNPSEQEEMGNRSLAESDYFLEKTNAIRIAIQNHKYSMVQSIQPPSDDQLKVLSDHIIEEKPSSIYMEMSGKDAHINEPTPEDLYRFYRGTSQLSEKPGEFKQQELNLSSPYEEDKVPQKEGEVTPSQPTVRGGFKALRTPHLEVEFKENGFLVFPNRKINSPADLAYGFKFLHNEAQENFFLGAIKDNHIVAVEHLAVGTIDQVAAYPYETINLIDKQAADGFFIVHNHPSGAVVPSEQDKELTNAMKHVMANNGIEFKGHVIIDDTKFGFIDPEGNVSEQSHITDKMPSEKQSDVDKELLEKGITKKTPILKKFFDWLKPKSESFGPLIANPNDAFEIFKGIQKNDKEGIAYLLNTQNELLNAIVIPHNKFDAGTLQRLAAAYRASGIISVESGLSDDAYKRLKRDLLPTDIQYHDDIELDDRTMIGFTSKLQRGLGEEKAKYQPDLIPTENQNLSDRYERLRQMALDQGMNPIQASKYAKDNLANKEIKTDGVKLKQQEFGLPGGVEGFGQGRKGEQELFEPRQIYGEKEASQRIEDSAKEIKEIVSPTSAAPLAAQITREQIGIMARNYDKAEAALESAFKLFDQQSNEKNIDFIDRMEKGIRQENQDLENIAKKLRILLDEKRQEIRALGTGKLDNFIENYFPHIWDQSEKKVSQAIQKAAKRPFEGSKSFLKQRKIEFTKEGIELGLTPVSFNPVDLALLKMREMDKYLMAHRTLNAYKENGLAQFVKIGKDMPQGWIKIDDKISTVFRPSEEGLVLTGYYYAQPDAARIINNYLSPGLQKSELYRSYRFAGNLLNQFQLGFSAFHLGFTSMDAIVSKTALGLNQLFKFNPKGAIKSFLSAPFAPVENIIRGNQLFNAWRGQGKSPMDEVMAQAMASGGGRARMDQFYATKAYDQMKKLFRSGKLIQGILHIPLMITEATTKPILEYIVPRQKLGVFADIMKMEMENNPNMTHEEMRTIAQRAWDSVDNRMGQLVYDNLFWNRTFKDLLMASVRSVGWNLGTIREIAGGAKDLVQMPIDFAKGKKTETSYRAAYLMALPIVAGLFGAIYQYLRTGKGPQELKDYYFPRTGGVDANGDPNRVALPTYMKDVYHYTQAPIKTLENKINPLLSMIGQMLSNKDYYGTKIRNEDDPIVKQVLSEAQFLLKEMEPFAFRNMQRQQKTGNQALPDVIGPWIGITPAPYDVNQTKAEKLAHEISASHQQIGGRTEEQANRSRLLSQLERRYRAGDDQAREDLFDSYRNGLISHRQMQDVIRDANLTPLQKMVRHFTVDEAQRVFDISNEDEKAQIGRILRRKIENKEREYVTQPQ